MALPQRHRLRGRRVFDRLYRQGRRFNGALMVLRLLPANEALLASQGGRGRLPSRALPSPDRSRSGGAAVPQAPASAGAPGPGFPSAPALQGQSLSAPSTAEGVSALSQRSALASPASPAAQARRLRAVAGPDRSQAPERARLRPSPQPTAARSPVDPSRITNPIRPSRRSSGPATCSVSEALSSWRCAVVVSGKVSRLAVRRNRLRRLLHAHLQAHPPRPAAPHWLMFSLRPGAADAEEAVLLGECDQLLHRAGLLP